MHHLNVSAASKMTPAGLKHASVCGAQNAGFCSYCMQAVYVFNEQYRSLLQGSAGLTITRQSVIIPQKLCLFDAGSPNTLTPMCSKLVDMQKHASLALSAL